MSDDVRMRGFRVRAELAHAQALLRATASPLPAESVAVTACAGMAQMRQYIARQATLGELGALRERLAASALAASAPRP